MISTPQVRHAELSDLSLVVPLFDAYRQFYRQPSDREGAERFLRQRMTCHDSVILVAVVENRIVGFTQLYPSFSSVSMAQILILNDLFVSPEARGCGVAAALLRAAADYGRSKGAVRLVLSTEVTNSTAQTVYERAGWTRDTSFYTYQLQLE